MRAVAGASRTPRATTENPTANNPKKGMDAQKPSAIAQPTEIQR